VPQPPVITSSTHTAATVGRPFNYRIRATNRPTSFAATPLPAGLAVNSSTGAITGTPTTVGAFSVQISATNAVGTGTATLALTVRLGPQPPVITSATQAAARVGRPFNYRIRATNRPTSFGAVGLPGGLTVDPATGAITGTPTTVGAFNVQISATNAVGTGAEVLALTVEIPTSGEPPRLGMPPTPWHAPFGGQQAWAPPPVYAEPPASPHPSVLGAQPTVVDMGRQLVGGLQGSRKMGIVAASGIVIQGLLTILAMTDGGSGSNDGR